MLTIQQLHNRLSDMNIRAVSKATGVRYNTVRSIAVGTNANPQYRVIESLSKYFEEREKAV